MKTRLRLVLSISVILPVVLAGAHIAAAGTPPDPDATAHTSVVVAYAGISAAGFTSFRDGYDYENHGRYLIHKGGPEGWYLSAVRLPHGATVTKMTFHWYDNSATQQAKARLQRTTFGQGNYLDMAYAESPLSETPGYGSSLDDTIGNASIDNSKYGYWVVFDLPPTADVNACGVVIEYNPPDAMGDVFNLSAAAFTPHEDGYDYENHGRFLKHLHSPGGGTANGWYLAPVRLPDGATVTKLTFHWYDNSAANQAKARLQRTEFGQGNFLEMAYTETPLNGAPGFGSSDDDTISYPAIDNSRYGYWVVWDLPADAFVSGAGVVIEYQAPATVSALLSSAAAPLKPHQDEYDYENHGRYLIHKGGPQGWYISAVRLPDGVVVSKVTFLWYDNSATYQAKARLQRTEFGQGNYLDMAYGESPLSGSPGYGSSIDDSVNYRTIDNTRYGYWVVFDLPATADVRACGLIVDYGQRIFLPVMSRNYTR